VRNLVLLVVALLSAAAGWWGGSWSGRSAQEALAKVKQAGEQAEADRAKVQQQVDGQIAALKAGYEKDLAALAEQHTARTTQMDAAIAGKDKRLAELAQAQTDKQARIRQLDAALATARTPQERQQIQVQIAQTQQEAKVVVAEADGIKCQSAQVPPALLAAWRGVTP
jgi:hypothetical protein